MSAGTSVNKTAAVLTCLVVVLIVLLAAVTVIQFRWTKQLQLQYEESRNELVRLQTSCLDDSDDAFTMEAIKDAVHISLELLEMTGEQEREKRQTTGSLEQMLTDMMMAQEKVLMSHCLNSSKLCIPGQKGVPGAKGDPGLSGKVGLPGQTGNPGTKGDMGPPGINGTKGDIGPQGDPGVNGTMGPAGVRGLKGDHGPSGKQGLPGKQGPPGIDGDKGDKGSVGPTGPMGNNGTIGPKGDKGDRGLNGTKGTVGPQGPTGPPGAALQNDCVCVIKPKIDTFRPNSSFASYNLGSQVDLYCGASSSPNTNVTWSGPLDGCVPAKVSGGNVHISSLQPSQLGVYTCTATNAFGTVSKSVTIGSNVSRALDCDFENGNHCLWTNENHTQMNWINHSGNTPTVSTGPSNDHTLGNTNGHYVYLETSSGLRGNFAKLVSPDLGQSIGMCLSLWYNMYGNEIGSLTVETEICNSNTPNKILLHLSGNQGKDWHMAQIQLRAVSENHRIIIKGVHGSGIYGDIAVDDIEYYTGKCRTTLSRTTGSPSQQTTVNRNSVLELDCGVSGVPPAVYHWKKTGGCPINSTKERLEIEKHVSRGNAGIYECTASNGNQKLTTTFNVTVNGPALEMCTLDAGWCGWSQSSNDQFDWTRHNGSTPSKETGPSFDHTNQTSKGQYAFIETSSPRSLGDAAILRSELMPANRLTCFRFAYHMYGAETGKLQVILEDACTLNHNVVFTLSGDKGQSWYTKSVNIRPGSTSHDYHILVKATVGTSYHGDIAIDDLSLYDGACT